MQGNQTFLIIRQLISYWRISQNCVHLEGSLSCRQVPSTDPYPEPDQSSHDIPSCLSKFISNSIFYLRLVLPSSLFPSGLPTNPLRAWYIFCPSNPPWHYYSNFTVCFKKSFATLTSYINLFRGHVRVQCFELSWCSKTTEFYLE
jgi:hypothetical protein